MAPFESSEDILKVLHLFEKAKQTQVIRKSPKMEGSA